MNRKLLLSSAAIALILGLTPALAQQDRTDSKMKRDPAATEQQHRNGAKQSAEQDSRAKQNAENKDRSGSRSTTGQASGESSDKAKAADTDMNKSGADKAKGAENDKTSSQPKQAEDQNKTPSGSAATNKSNAAEPSKNAQTNKANTAEPSKNAEQNNARSPAAQKSTQSNESNRNAPSNARSNETNRNAQTSEPNRNTAESKDASGNTRISASLDPQKKSRLTTAFDKVDVKPVTHVNFAVSVGTVVPRDIELRPVPRTIVEIVPQYRDYDFFVVRDEIVIVQPRTHKIVDVIERSPSRARAETTTEHRPRLSAHQREIIRRHASSKRHVTTGSSTRTTTEITVGQKVPDTVEIESFPEEVYREVPSVREYRYIDRGDDVYLVDPSTREVIEEVR